MSSPSITSRRRSRDDGDDDGSENTASEDAVAEQPHKRRRHGNEDDDDGEISPVLPDNYRRSPKGKGRASDARHDGSARQDHHPGAIVRVKLTDFVTYSKAEFHPGPNLNMVIGPNGTGKSTLVCAICIGLGWSTSHLGRAKDITEFVKHGKKSAEIEIELKGDPARHSGNQVITHIINKDGGNKAGAKSVFRINGKRSNSKEVQALARSFSIQVDNLCQFLPQDRVVEFAALSPVDLLVQTQRAAAPDYMSQWHDELKEMGKQHKHKQTEQQRYIDELKKAEDRQRSQEGIVTRLRERNNLQERIRIMEKLKPFALYKAKKDQHREAKERSKAAAAELRRLQERLQPNIDAIGAKKRYHDQLDNHVSAQKRLLKRLEDTTSDAKRTLAKTAAEADECDSELANERRNGKTAKENIIKFQNEIRRLENAMKDPPAAFDSTAMNEEIREKKRQVREIEKDMEATKASVRELQEQARQRTEIIEMSEAKKVHLQSQAGQQTSRLQSKSADAARAWTWIQQNLNRFDSEVHGPPMISCSVKNPRHADAVETFIGASDLLSFTVTCQKDFRMLSDQLYNHLNLPGVAIRSINQPFSGFGPPCSDEDLHKLGGQQWMVDLLEGPEAVLAMLCDNKGIHTTAFTTNNVSDRQFEELKSSDLGALVTPSKMFTISRRKEYGAAGTSTRLVDIRRATHMVDVPIDTQEEQDIHREIVERRGELAEIKQEIAGLNTHFSQLNAQRCKVDQERDALQTQKNAKQDQKSQFDGLLPKLENAKRKLKDSREVMEQQSSKRMQIVKKHDDLVLKKGQQALDYANTTERLRKFYVEVFEAEIMRIEAKSDMEQLQARYQEEQKLFDTTEQEVIDLSATTSALRDEGRALGRECQQLGDSLTREETEFYEAQEGNLTIEQLSIDIEQVQAQLDSLHGGSDNMIKEFEERAKHIEDKRKQLATVERVVEQLSAKITERRESWEPELDRVVGQISEAFAENFSRIHCAGEVAVHKDDDFEQWAIEIRVKFRENEQLSVLDAHRQSGGERAVSTIFYLMALQSLARAPFRVVDEINQGMDPRNERLVHSRMVEIACAEHTSQYFLITPKLLNNLIYHKSMKVHCIASGEYMPSDYRELDFGMLAKKALQIKAGAS